MNNEKINYKVVEFSLEKAKIKGNKVVLRGDHSFEPEWYYFNKSDLNWPIASTNIKGEIMSLTSRGFVFNEVDKNNSDLVILEQIKEIKVNAIIESSIGRGLNFKILKEDDCIDSMTSLYEVTFINDEPIKIEKI